MASDVGLSRSGRLSSPDDPFNVFDGACAEGEDAFHMRRGDVLTPIRRFADQAFDCMLPFYGITKRQERREAIKTGRLHALARVLQGPEWVRLADRMDSGRIRPESEPQGAAGCPVGRSLRNPDKLGAHATTVYIKISLQN